MCAGGDGSWAINASLSSSSFPCVRVCVCVCSRSRRGVDEKTASLTLGLRLRRALLRPWRKEVRRKIGRDSRLLLPVARLIPKKLWVETFAGRDRDPGNYHFLLRRFFRRMRLGARVDTGKRVSRRLAISSLYRVTGNLR